VSRTVPEVGDEIRQDLFLFDAYAAFGHRRGQ
jgi:hypothetical protein